MNLGSMQGDQIGLFLNVLGENFLLNIAKTSGYFLGYFEKCHYVFN